MEKGHWIPYKILWNTCQEFATQKTDNSAQQLKLLLRKYKPQFLSLLKNPSKNADHRAKVKNAQSTGLLVHGESNPRTFNESFIEESLIISDLFDLNELSSVDLLLAGQQHMPNYPNYTRGLVAVLLYWDGRRNFVSTLRNLIQCRRGRTFTSGVDSQNEAVNMVTSFTDELIDNGMVQQILKFLESFSVEGEMIKLGQQRGLGDAKHRKQVRDLMVEVQQCLAECLFYFAAQSGLKYAHISAIVKHMEVNVELNADGELSPPALALLFAVLYAFTLPSDATVENDTAAIEELLEHPLLSEENFLSSVHKLLVPSSFQQSKWKVGGIGTTLQFAWSLSLRSLVQIPSSLFTGTNTQAPNPDVLEQDESTLEMALADRVFLFMERSIVSSTNFHLEEFYMRRIHGLITDFIVSMPLKIKEMRNHGDEVARILMLHLMEGEQPPAELRKDFQQFMEIITTVYSKDPLQLNLSSDYWYTNEQTIVSDAGSFVGHRLNQRLPHKQMSLFKFIRQSGDLLPPLLYIPYLKMLAALSTGNKSARVAFEMLRANGINNGQSGESSMISWDHFFSSCRRYYENLRHEKQGQESSNPYSTSNPFTAQSHPHPSSPSVCTITPHEVEGLRAVMQLIIKIAQYDEIACIDIYGNGSWQACEVLYGLLQCPVPPRLKGDILIALTQLARIPDIALGLMQATESVQLLSTGTTLGNREGGLISELEEVETREEQFSMTRGFLQFITSLAECGNKLTNYVDGTRTFGFSPYLTFVVESIFLKFLQRAYTRPEEKWEVATESLLLFNKVISSYQPSPEHFNSEKNAVLGNSSMTQHSFYQDAMSLSANKQAPRLAGFSLLLYIYNEGTFFKCLMEILEECLKYLDSYEDKPKLNETLIETASLSLQLILSALEQQDLFLAAMRESGQALLITTLDKLLLGVNPKTGKPDYILNIARFVIHHDGQSHLSHLSSQIISFLCFQSSTTHNAVTTAITTNQSVKRKVLHGFVDILDTSCSEMEEEMEEDSSKFYISQTRLVVLRLLVRCVNYPAPNFAHFLLGFDISKPLNKANLQDPGTLGSSRSCLHSILTILSFGTDVYNDTNLSNADTQPYAVNDTPKLAELCYQLVYKLVGSMDTTEPVLRYLRSSYDFVCRHLQYLPFQNTDMNENSVLLQQSWLMKIAAVDLFSLTTKQQRTNTQRTLQILFQSAQKLNTTLNASNLIGQSLNQSNLMTRSLAGDTLFNNTTLHSMSIDVSRSMLQTGAPKKDVIKIIEIFNKLDFVQDFPPPLQLEEFVASVVEEGIRSCETTNSYGVVYCDIKALHGLLEANVNSLNVTEDQTRRFANQDMQKILQTAVMRNQTRETMHARLSFLSAWQQVLEIALTVCQSDLLPKEERQQVLLSILQQIVSAVKQEDVVQQLTSPLASVALTLVMQIRSCYIGRKSNNPEKNFDIFNDSNLSQLLNSEGNMEINMANILPLQLIIGGLIEWLLQSGLSVKVRTHLYACLSYYLQLCEPPKDPNNKGQRNINTGLHTVKEDVYSRVMRENLKLFKSFGTAVMDVLCNDACSGQSVCRVLALSCLDAIIQIDHQQAWLNYMGKKGYIANIAHSFSLEDESLQQFLNPLSEPLRCVYIYEQKMALLSTIVMSTGGARLLIDSGVLTQLAECNFLELRPGNDHLDFSPTSSKLLSRYRQLLFPALRLCSSFLTSLGGRSNHEGSALVLQFMLSHSNPIITSVLNVQSLLVDTEDLTELKLVTGILCQTASHDFSDANLFGSISHDVLMELQAHMFRIQRQLLSLLPHFFVSNQFLKEIRTKVEQESEAAGNPTNFQQIVLLYHEIGVNILSYCRSICVRGDNDSAILLFSPNLAESSHSDSYYGMDESRRQPNLGFLVRILRTTLTRFQAQIEQRNQLNWKLENISNLTTQDLKEVIASRGTVDNAALSIPQEQKLATVLLKKSVKTKAHLLDCLFHTLESTTLLLWQHIDHYVMKAVPIVEESENILFPNSASGSSFARRPVRKLQDISNVLNITTDDSFAGSIVRETPLGIRKQDINRLKDELSSSLPNEILKKLASTEVQYNGDSGAFIQPLVRRMQHVIKLHTT